jgi:hypothetical protein
MGEEPAQSAVAGAMASVAERVVAGPVIAIAIMTSETPAE